MEVITGPSASFVAQQQQSQPDLVGQYSRLLQLKNLQQQQALAPLQLQEAQQRVQSGQLALQQEQRQADSQKAIMDAWSNSGGDLSKTYSEAAKTGKVLPGDLAKLQQANYQLQTQSMELLKAKGERALQEADMFSGAAEAVKAAPPEQRPTIYQQQIANLAKNGVDVSQAPQQYPGDEAFNAMSLGLQSHKVALEQAAKQAETFKNQQQGNEAQAQTAKIQQETQFGPIGPAAEGKYRFILQKAASGQTLSPDEVAFAKGFEASNAKNTTQSDTLGITSNSTSRPAGLASVLKGGKATAPSTGALSSGGSGAPLPSSTLPSSVASSPANVKANTVDLIGQYRMDPALLGRMLYKHPEMLGMINAKYPDWDQTSYQAKNNIVKSYTSGPESKSINAIGTALGHANELRDAIDALGNGDAGLKTLRNIGNKIGVEVGDDRVTAFNTIVHRLAPELTAAYVQGGGGEGERIAAAEDFSPSMARGQLIKNWSETVKLLQSKIAQQQQQWNSTYRPSRPEDQFTNRFLSPVAKQAIDRWSSETGNQSALGGGSAPKEGATKTNSHGDKVTFHNGAWVLQ